MGENADDVFLELVVEEPPQNCEGTVTPEEGTVAETSFSISIVCDKTEKKEGDKDEDDDDLVAESGTLINKRWTKGKSESISEPIEIGEISATGNITIVTRVRNRKNGLFTLVKTKVSVNE